MQKQFTAAALVKASGRLNKSSYKTSFYKGAIYKGAIVLSVLCSGSSLVYADANCLGNTHSGPAAICDYDGSPTRTAIDTIGNTYKTVVTNGTSTIVTGTITLDEADDGYDGTVTLDYLKPWINDTVIDPDLDPDIDVVLEEPLVTLGLRNKIIQYTDPITGTQRDVPVYDSDLIVTTPLKNSGVDTFHGVDQNQYEGLTLGEVDATGGTLRIQADFQNPGSTVGDVTIALNDGILYHATGDGTAESRIIWDAPTKTTFIMAAATTQENEMEWAYRDVSLWPVDVDVTLLDGSIVNYTINDAQEFKDFNDDLQSYITNNELDPTPSVYANYINQALNLRPVSIEYEKQVENPYGPTDLIYKNNGPKTIIYATGEGAIAEIAENSELEAYELYAMLRGDEGAELINNGILNARKTTGLRAQTSAASTVRTVATNNNVIDSSFNSTAIYGSNSDLINAATGIINVRIFNGDDTTFGMVAENNTVAHNYGIINVGANTGAGVMQTGAYGAYINNSEFTNHNMIYIGREAQYDVNDPTIDNVINAASTVAGIEVRGDSIIENLGQIIVGSHSDGVEGIRVNNTHTAQVSHRGDIIIHGDTARAKGNRAFSVYNSGERTVLGDVVTNIINVEQDGMITLDGSNALGLYIHANGAGQTSAAGMHGHILLEGDLSPSTGTRNYGAWVEGAGGGFATSDVTGQITLAGTGGVGLHARGNSEINVVGGGDVVFSSGTDQIGYFIHGPEARINLQRNDLSVSTERSTLFRIENGAMFDGQNYHVSVTGKDAIGVLALGAGSAVDIKNGIYDVSEDGGTAVRIMGGAKGWIHDETSIRLLADKTRGIVVDGDNFNIYGQRIGSKIAGTEANTSTSTYANANDIIGFSVRNTATLNFKPSDALPISPIGLVTSPAGVMQAHFLGNNSTAFKGEYDSNFDIHSVNTYANGLVFDLISGNHVVNLVDSSAYGTVALMQNTTDPTNTQSNAQFSVQNSYLHGIVTTDSASITDIDLDDASTWVAAGNSNITNLNNNGFISLSAPSWDNVFKTLDVAGDYTGGQDSSILLYVKLNDGVVQQTDKLILGNSYGFSTLFIKNGGGFGQKTKDDGIEIIEVLGTSDAEFELGHRVFAGAYEYGLFKGGVTTANGNWYLRSVGLRPEVPIYSAANDFVARNGKTMLGTYRDRYGFADTNTEQERGWGRVFGNTGDAKHSRVTPIVDTRKFFKYGSSYDYNFAGFQAGMDLLRRGGDSNPHDYAGVYVGYGHGKADVNHVTEIKAGTLEEDAYSIGAYWTRLSEDKSWYVDGVLQATYFDLSSKTYLGRADSTHGMSYAASLEGGYNIPLNSSGSWAIEPQAQLLYQFTDIDNITDYAGHIEFASKHNLYGRLGARLLTTHARPDAQPLKAWLRADVWHDLSQKTHTSFSSFDKSDATKIKDRPVGTWGQVGIGVSGHLSDNVSMFVSGDYNHSLTSEKDHGWNGRIGLAVQW